MQHLYKDNESRGEHEATFHISGPATECCIEYWERHDGVGTGQVQAWPSALSWAVAVWDEFVNYL